MRCEELVDQRLKDLANNRKKTDRTIIGGVRIFSRVFNIGTTDAIFQQAGKQDSVKHLLNSLERIEESSGEQFCKTVTGMLSGPQAMQEFNQDMTLAKEVGVI